MYKPICQFVLKYIPPFNVTLQVRGVFLNVSKALGTSGMKG